ncbi:anaerobic ribonucleoside-triphosphate reductase activating protein [Tepidibacter formicigenes]|uniref:Anaerobic ribonucleoside-triphosphate reductase-activating protein n=1 Tax=Tepidibacter formicigenes DSM 15518 TaxID=1123349 RepID=A0A1M6TDB6_9FIRM|nr:anaerobic ribonucleoside-triphosphate reductase activating protein [Tepidibacter formicigenes]SHK54953.1 anaerobic ribonucleoside-triphosphate reductase activating protein [Tepidibacter formicigenes DSM 15518]
MKIRLASPLTIDSIVDGPGLRTVIWAQGCNHKCKGCHNPSTHDFSGGFKVDVKDIIDEIKKLKLQRGITLSGGEPFEQPDPLIKICKEAKKLGLDIWAYSGYTFEQLIDTKNPRYFKWKSLLENIDTLVDGKFIESKKSLLLKFRGSSNQRIIDVQKSLKLKKAVLHLEYIENMDIAK